MTKNEISKAMKTARASTPPMKKLNALNNVNQKINYLSKMPAANAKELLKNREAGLRALVLRTASSMENQAQKHKYMTTQINRLQKIGVNTAPLQSKLNAKIQQLYKNSMNKVPSQFQNLRAQLFRRIDFIRAVKMAGLPVTNFVMSQNITPQEMQTKEYKNLAKEFQNFNKRKV